MTPGCTPRLLGRLLVGCSILLLLFIVYQLFGTGLPASMSQTRLRHQLTSVLSQRTTAQPDTVSSPLPDALKAPSAGSALGVIDIPSINVDKAMVQGVGVSDLQEGPGHYPSTPLPGEAGNAAVAGHRTTYGAPFFRLNELRKGQPIYVTTAEGTFTYHVLRSLVVKPSDASVLSPTGTNMLTLTTCSPRYSATQRLIVEAVLQGAPLADVPAAAPTRPQKQAKPQVQTLAAAGRHWLPALLWGLALLALGIVAGYASRKLPRHKWLVYLAATPVSLVGLYVFFDNLSLLLPATF
ncbi:MAG: class E sortase [Acidimicrobiales bacterium]